jgi:hypothetical protein
LMLAIGKRHFNVARALLTAGADPNKPNSVVRYRYTSYRPSYSTVTRHICSRCSATDGKSPLKKVDGCACGSMFVCRDMLQNHRTPFIQATVSGDLSLIKWFAKNYDVDIRAQDSVRNTTAACVTYDASTSASSFHTVLHVRYPLDLWSVVAYQLKLLLWYRCIVLGYACVRVCACMCMCMCACLHVYMCVCVCLHVCVCVLTCVCMCMWFCSLQAGWSPIMFASLLGNVDIMKWFATKIPVEDIIAPSVQTVTCVCAHMHS